MSKDRRREVEVPPGTTSTAILYCNVDSLSLVSGSNLSTADRVEIGIRVMSGVKRVIEEMRDSDDRRVVGRIVSASSKSGRIPCKKKSESQFRSRSEG